MKAEEYLKRIKKLIKSLAISVVDVVDEDDIDWESIKFKLLILAEDGSYCLEFESKDEDGEIYIHLASEGIQETIQQMWKTGMSLRDPWNGFKLTVDEDGEVKTKFYYE